MEGGARQGQRQDQLQIVAEIVNGQCRDHVAERQHAEEADEEDVEEPGRQHRPQPADLPEPVDQDQHQGKQARPKQEPKYPKE